MASTSTPQRKRSAGNDFSKNEHSKKSKEAAKDLNEAIPDLDESDEDLEMSNLADIEELNELKRKVKILDPESLLCIHEYIESYQTDCLVREYTDNLLELEYLPIVPSDEIMKAQLKGEEDLQIPTELSKTLLNNYICALQTRYFHNQTKEATAFSVTLFNPRMNFFFPQFALYPAETMKKMTELKTAFVIHMQDQAWEGSKFPYELLLLRNMKIIKESLKGEDSTISAETLKLKQYSVAAMMYLKATMEIVREYNVKTTDWEHREGKVIHSEPQWRKVSPDVPPEARSNYYANKIKTRVDEGKEVMNEKLTLRDYEVFLSQSKSKIAKANRNFSKSNGKSKSQSSGHKKTAPPAKQGPAGAQNAKNPNPTPEPTSNGHVSLGGRKKSFRGKKWTKIPEKGLENKELQSELTRKFK